MRFRLTLLAIVFVSVMLASQFWRAAIQPEVAAQLSLNAVNGNETDAAILRTYTQSPSVTTLAFVGVLVFAFFLFLPDMKRGLKSMRLNKVSVLICALLLFSSVGCKPYEQPVYENVDTNETAFVVPLEGDTGKQVKFDSAEALERYKVATKRIQVTRRWNQTGRPYFVGEYIPTIRVVKVNRSPVTREWKSDTKGEGNGIWVESSDSVGFCTGFSITAMVEEADTAMFLYKYKGDQLANVMDSEVRARVQSIAAEVSAKYKMDDLRTKKNEIIAAIRGDVVPFFKDRGVTITTIGMFGGFTYENDNIQVAIDNVFVAQQAKEVAAAQLAAQNDINKRLKQEGEGEADKLREIAKGKKDAAITASEGEAQGVRLVAQATAEAQQNPLFLQLRVLEVQQKQIERWNGTFPQWYMVGTDKSPMLMLQMEPPAQK